MPPTYDIVASRGADGISNSAAEIGFAFAIGKTIIGYRGDVRTTADNLSARVNLQVEGFILESGGEIVYSIDQLVLLLSKIREKVGTSASKVRA